MGRAPGVAAPLVSPPVPVVGSGASVRACGSVAAGVSTRAASAADSAGACGVGVLPVLPSSAAGAAGVDSAAGLPGAFFAADFLTGAFLAGALASRSFSRRSTGASTVDEADRTNSPMSFNVFSTSLLVTPSSFASS